MPPPPFLPQNFTFSVALTTREKKNSLKFGTILLPYTPPGIILLWKKYFKTSELILKFACHRCLFGYGGQFLESGNPLVQVCDLYRFFPGAAMAVTA